MRRFVTLVVLLLFSIPFGISISGCSRHAAPTFCNGGDSGVTTGQATTISLLPKVYGISLNYAEIGQVNTPSATDCKGSPVSIGSYTYSSSDPTIADVQPTTGRLCAGTWNRNTGGGIPDFTVCNPTNKSGTAYIVASADSVPSNPLPVFVHPVVTSIVLGGPSSNCTTDPTTACCPLATVGEVTAPPYTGNSCVSQGSTVQLVARVYAGTGANQTNISCLAGHLQFSAQGGTSTTSISPVVNIDQNGVATANQPGSTLISANVANAASSAGFFSTCPPASISLTAPTLTSGGSVGQSNPVTVNLNNTQPLTATVKDTNGVTLTGLSLEYVSSNPSTIVTSSAGTVTPTYSGAASVTAICQPSTCNPSSYNQIGLFGNGKPIISNPVDITTPGTNGTVLYMASTQSEYVVPIDFTANVLGAPFLLPYYPNSMVISNDGLTIYMGSSTALMVLNAVNSLTLIRADVASPGVVLSISPDGTTIVLSDPVRKVITLESSSGSVISTYGGVGVRAAWAPDGQTVYITTGTVTTQQTPTTPAVIAPGNQVLVYSGNTGWTPVTDTVPASDVTVTVPSVGAYFAGSPTTARGYCAASTVSAASGTPTTTNSFYPPADTAPTQTDRIAATNDGLHVLGATVTPTPTLSDLHVTIPSGACPATGGLTFSNTLTTSVLSGVNATAITGVIPTSDSALAFITYTGSGGVLPVYAPAASGPGTTTYIQLSGTATAPIKGVESSDNSMFYVGTSGDDLVHLIDRSTLKDTSTLAPKLTDANGNVVPVNLMVQKPRKTT